MGWFDTIAVQRPKAVVISPKNIVVSIADAALVDGKRQLARRRFAKAAVSLEVFLSVGALGGGLALMLGPRGEIIPLPVSALRGSPFETYFAPGLILFCALGLGPLAAGLLGHGGPSARG
jgi:hypothetical protein